MKIDVIGMDNQYYIVYLKKRDKKVVNTNISKKDPIGLKIDLNPSPNKSGKKDGSSNLFNLIPTQPSNSMTTIPISNTK